MSEENNYIESIPEEYRDVPSIKEAGSMDNLLKGYVNLETKMGTAVFKPGDDADEEQWNSFYGKVNELAPGLTRVPTKDDDEKGWNSIYSKLGRPDDVSGYNVPEIKMGDDGVLDQSQYADDFKKVSHELGITGKQFTGLMNWIGQRTVDRLDAGTQKRDEVMAGLKKEWGDGTDARIKRVNELIMEQGGKEAYESIGELGNNPYLIKMLDKMADTLMDESSLERQGPAGDIATRTAIEDEISTLKKNAAFLDRKDPDHQRTVERVNALYEKLETFKAA